MLELFRPLLLLPNTLGVYYFIFLSTYLGSIILIWYLFFHASSLQPSFLVTLLASKENLNGQLNVSGGGTHQTKDSLQASSGLEKSSIIDALLQYLKEANKHAKRFIS